MPRGNRGACQLRPVAVTTAPSRGTPETRSAPRGPGGGMRRLALAAAPPAGAARDAEAGAPAQTVPNVTAAVATATRTGRPARRSPRPQAGHMPAPIIAISG